MTDEETRSYAAISRLLFFLTCHAQTEDQSPKARAARWAEISRLSWAAEKAAKESGE